jgi:hypothetical protein
MESRGSGLLYWQYSWGLEQVWWIGFQGKPIDALLYKHDITWEDGKAVVRGDLADVLLCDSSLGRFLWIRFSPDRWSSSWGKDNEDIVWESKGVF